MQEIPVYLFTGFMDSGKTTLIKETLFENDFGGDNRTVIIVCEDGDEEYDEAKLNTINAKVAMIEEQEDFTTETLQKIQETYKPEQIFIEYNGTWDIATLLETKMPDGWVIVQSLATVDATTFEMYLANMRAMIMEQLFKADVVIFNRCDDNTPKGKFRPLKLPWYALIPVWSDSQDGYRQILLSVLIPDDGRLLPERLAC